MTSKSKGASHKRGLRRGSQRKPRGSRTPLTRILFLSQGRVTEPEYFKKLSHHLGWHKNLALQFDYLSAPPNTMVQKANDEIREDNYDYVVVFSDVDEFSEKQFEKAQALTNRYKDRVKLVITAPKFDLWLCAHYRPMRSSCDDAYVTKIEKELAILQPPRNSSQTQRRKHIPSAFPIEDYPTAMKNVTEAAYGRWDPDGSTSIPAIINFINELANNHSNP